MSSSGGTGDDGELVSSWFDWIPSWLLDYSSFEETENEDLESIGIVAGYNIALAFIFWLYWTCKWCPHVGGVVGEGAPFVGNPQQQNRPLLCTCRHLPMRRFNPTHCVGWAGAAAR